MALDWQDTTVVVALVGLAALFLFVLGGMFAGVLYVLLQMLKRLKEQEFQESLHASEQSRELLEMHKAVVNNLIELRHPAERLELATARTIERGGYSRNDILESYGRNSISPTSTERLEVNPMTGEAYEPTPK